MYQKLTADQKLAQEVRDELPRTNQTFTRNNQIAQAIARVAARHNFSTTDVSKAFRGGMPKKKIVRQSSRSFTTFVSASAKDD